MKIAHEDPSITTGKVIANPCIAPDHYLLTLSLDRSFVTPKPGQFIMIRDSNRREPLLSRPLSVYGFRREGDQVSLDLLYRVTGRGTAIFSQIKPGAFLTVLGPLGQGFTMHSDVRNVILLAGGVGVAPLIFLLHEGYLRNVSFQGIRITAYIGARTAELLTGLDRLQGFCDFRTATDDGSSGYHGFVTDLLQRDLDGYVPHETMIYACGPAAMNRSLVSILHKSAIRCEVSLEERMACGVGACLGCAVAVKDGQGRNIFRRVCHDGPVFNLYDMDMKP